MQGIAVDIGCCAYVGMSKPCADALQGNPLSNQYRCRQMPQSMEPHRRNPMSLQKSAKPVGWRVWVHRLTVPLSEYPVAIDPLVSKFQSCSYLFPAIIFQKSHRALRQCNIPDRRFVLWALREHAQAQSVPKYLNALSLSCDRVMFYGERA